MTDTPFCSGLMIVKPDWIDYNGHLNMAYYNVLMDLASDEVLEMLGLGPDYRARTGCTTYSAEYRMQYKQELHAGDQVRVTLQLIDHSDRSFHFVQQLYHTDGWLAARGEGLGLHVDQAGARVVPMPKDTLARMRALRAAHSTLPVPEWTQTPIRVRHAAGAH
ncbi:MAG: thioesterase family protein [Rhodobacteraceae bacterium]|nr:thioesterase family protein [Paracoccaceae bacterium]